MKHRFAVVGLTFLAFSVSLLATACGGSSPEPAAPAPEAEEEEPNIEPEPAADTPLETQEDAPGDASGTRVAGGGAGRAPSPEGGDCGGLAGFGCEEGLFCKFAIDAHCGAADQMGACAVPSQACTRDYRPVCGCDGKTYSNECSAHAAGTSAAQSGACAE